VTLVVVLLFGLGSVLIISAIQTDPATGKSTSVLATIQDVWNNKLDFTQPTSAPAANGGGSGGTFSYVPPSPSTTTLLSSPVGLQGNAATAAYLASHQV
jgi:hypothetical protein